MQLKFCLILLAQAILLLCFNSPIQAANVVDTKAVLAKGTQLIKAKQYNEAVQLFSDAAARKPKNSVLQYYLGMACIYANRGREAELALSKAIAVTKQDTELNRKATELIYKYRRIKPYSCLSMYLKPPQMIRWSRNKMPISIYIYDGKLLPQVFDDEVLDGQECIQIGNWAKSPSFTSRLKTSSLYNREHKEACITGIQRWQWASQEQLLSFKFINDPSRADILVFWCEKLRGYGGWTYHAPIIKENPVPVIIMMNLEFTKGRDSRAACYNMSRIMTHEFGHAIGLDHSPYEETTMFPKINSKNKEISAADKASVRAFYSLPGDIIFPSVSKR